MKLGWMRRIPKYIQDNVSNADTIDARDTIASPIMHAHNRYVIDESTENKHHSLFPMHAASAAAAKQIFR